MNVLHIVNVSSPYPGNLNASIWSLDGTAGDMVYVYPMSAEGIDYLVDEEKRGRKLYYRSQIFLKDIWLFYRLCRKYRIDILHLHFWRLKDQLIIKIVRMLLKIRGQEIHSCIHHHSMYAVSESRIREIIKRWFFKGFLNICVSDGMYRQMIAWGFAKDSLAEVDNCLVFSRLDEYRELEWGGRNALVFAGIGCHIKGTDIACKGVAEYNKEHQNKQIILRIVCAVKQADVETYVNELFSGEIPEWIRFLPPVTDVASYYRAADVFLSTSRSEGLCYSVLESVYCGIEPIQSEIPGHRLDIPECKTFESEDWRGLADCLDRVFGESAEVRKRLTSLQRKYVMEHYSIERWNFEMEEIYRKMIDEWTEKRF